MTGTKDHGAKSLIAIQASDILGVGKIGVALIEAISAGIGKWWEPKHYHRVGEAERLNFRNWVAEVQQAGLSSSQADLTLSERALIRLTANEMHRQSNREGVASSAIECFKQEVSPSSNGPIEAEPPKIDIEWLDQFWRLAQDVSNEDMQTVWGRILSRQAAGTGSYSARTLHTLSMLSKSEASLLEKMATVTISGLPDGIDAIMTHFHFGFQNYATKQADDQLTLAAGILNTALFGSIGILIESGWAHGIHVTSQDPALLKIGAKKFEIRGTSKLAKPPHLLPIGSGYAYAPVGKEIISLVRTVPNNDYLQSMRDGLKLVGLDLGQVE